MTASIKRLGPGDEAALALLAAEDADFDLDERGGPLRPADSDTARRYLSNPAVLFWVAVEDEAIVGFLKCIVLPLRAGEAEELLLYEIGVRRAWRGRETGRRLLTHMETWMRAHDLGVVWVLADNPGAVDFYRACAFAAEEPQPVYMIRQLAPAAD